MLYKGIFELFLILPTTTRIELETFLFENFSHINLELNQFNSF